MRKYYCQYCGYTTHSMSSLAANICTKHPNGLAKGKHKLYEGDAKSVYRCRYCGKESDNVAALTSGHCHMHPNGITKGLHLPE